MANETAVDGKPNEFVNVNILYIEEELKKQMIEEAIFVKSNCSNFIQIADVFAFYIEKYWSIKKGYKNYGEIKNNHCIKMYSILESKISLVGSEFLTKYVPFKSKEYYE